MSVEFCIIIMLYLGLLELIISIANLSARKLTQCYLKNPKLLRNVKCMFSVKEDVNNNNNNKNFKKELCMIRTF